MGDSDLQSSATSASRKTEKLVVVRDSKDPSGPKLFISSYAWKKFIKRIKAGDYDLE